MANSTTHQIARLALWATTLSVMLGGCALFRAAQRPADDGAVPHSATAVARGEYLVNNVLDCAGCHGGLNPATKAVDRNLPMVGGGVYGHAQGLPGDIPIPNITQAPKTGIGLWSDAEIMRAVREGVTRSGRALFPIMPYPEYAKLSDVDAGAVVAYLRTLAPIENEVPERRLDFPLNFVVNLMPKPLHGAVPEPSTDVMQRGQYLVEVAGCAGCHTPIGSMGQPDKTKLMAGGHALKFVDNAPDEPSINLPNITSDKATGIGEWTDAQLKTTLTQGRRPDGTYLKPAMPWLEYSKLAPTDVDAMVAYLRTIKPVHNAVMRSP